MSEPTNMTAKTMMQCLNDVQLNQFIDSEIEADCEHQVMAHVATCDKCQQALERIAGNDQLLSEVRLHLAEQREKFDSEATHDEFDQGRQQRDLLKVQQMLGPTDNPSMIGRLGQYEVCGIIGRGSAGIVVKALDTRLNRYVAIKMLAPIYSTNGSSRRRFEREGRAIASVKDPNVVPIHTVGEFQGTPYIVMQYVPDGSLQQRIDRAGPLNTRDATCLGMQVANGLAAAHRRGIVHRDVKPANVLLESGVESALVTDFGLARVVDEATMTRSGAISGTPQFMSPEQARGESVDPRSDLFSLGSVMYAACTGHSPFRAESVFGVIKRVCENEPRPIREYNPDIEPWLVGLIAKLHAKEPQDRFESAEQVAEVLSRELAHLENPTMVDEPARDWWEKPKPKPLPPKQTLATSSLKQPRMMLRVVGACLLVALGIGTWQQIGAGNLQQWLGSNPSGGANNGGTVGYSSMPESWASMSPQALLDMLRQENQELEKFEHTIEKQLQVKSGGKLILRTNLGGIDIATHDEPTVKLVLVHTVGAKDQATADKLFAAAQLRYEATGEDESNWDVSPGDDAVVVAEFPIGKLSDQEIEQADDLEALKEQLLIRKNSHYRNAHFRLQVPKQFQLDVKTMAGPIHTQDIDGWVKLQSYAGDVVAGEISGNATLSTQAGDITVMRVDGTLDASTQGGDVEAAQLFGEANVKTQAGDVEIGLAKQPVTIATASGEVRVWMAENVVDATVEAGSIEVNYVEQPAGDSRLHTQTGGIEIGYVDDLSFDIVADSNLGKIRSPFANQTNGHFEHVLNDGKYRLEASSSLGSIKFHEVNPDELKQEYGKQQEQREASRAFQRAYDTHMAGRIEEAVALHQHAAEYSSYRGIATYNLACAYALLGRSDDALQELQNAYEFGYRDVDQYRIDTDLDSLRETDKFKAIMEKLQGKVTDDQGNSCDKAECEDIT